MSSRCDVCGKTPGFGRAVARLGHKAQNRRVKGRSPRLFRPNVQRVRVIISGTPRRLDACTSCIKRGKLIPA
jgi:large subunit ribosomal protein L28